MLVLTLICQIMALTMNAHANNTAMITIVGDSKAKVAQVTDLEGSNARLQSFLDGNEVVYEKDGRLYLRENGYFVFGGDAVDRGDAGIFITELLLDFKRRYPDRVFLIAGNRDINKIRIPDYLITATTKGSTPLERLHYFFSRINAREAFGFRKAELEKRDNRLFSDNEVVEDFLNSLKKGGSHFEFLMNAQLAVRINNTLYIHGALTEENFGAVPRTQMKFDRLNIWAKALNDWYQIELRKWILHPSFEDYEGAKALVEYQQPIGLTNNNPHSVVYGRFSDETGTSYLPSRELIEKLSSQGIFEIISGHTPQGEAPTVLVTRSSSGRLFRVIIADNSYSATERSAKIYSTVQGTEIKTWVNDPRNGELKEVRLSLDDKELPLVGRRLKGTGETIKAEFSNKEFLLEKFNHSIEPDGKKNFSISTRVVHFDDLAGEFLSEATSKLCESDLSRILK
jgi:hypothetical protein